MPHENVGSGVKISFSIFLLILISLSFSEGPTSIRTPLKVEDKDDFKKIWEISFHFIEDSE